MDELARRSTRPANAIRWIARIVGTLFIAIFLVFFVADCIKKGTIPVPSDRIPMTIFLFLAFIGLAIAWKWEGTGGALALCSIIVSCVLGLRTELKPGATILLTGMYALPAFLFLLCWWQTRSQHHPDSKTPPD
jgi:uncharacterized protein YacL